MVPMITRMPPRLSEITPKWLFGVISVLFAIFVAGWFARDWLSERLLRNLLHEFGITATFRTWSLAISSNGLARGPDINSHFYQLRVESIELELFGPRGGSLDEFGDGVVFATTKGRLGFASRDGHRTSLDESVPMNEAALLAYVEDEGLDRIPQTRVADILAHETRDGVSKLFVSHHYYVDRCIEFRISSIQLELDAGVVRLTGPWELVYVARPCINPNVTKPQATFAKASRMRVNVWRVATLSRRRSRVRPPGRTSCAAR